MPIIVRFAFCVICINPREHNPPHFHVRMNDGREALIEIDTLAILATEVARREIREALSWAEANRELLKRKFEEYNP